MTERSWEISTFKEQDKADMLAIIREQYGDVDRTEEAYFDWLRIQSPPDIPQRVVREKATGRVLTSSARVAVRASWRGEEIPVMLGFDIVVAKAYRRQGIHTTLVAQGEADTRKAGYRFVSVFPNQKSMPQLVRSKNHHLISQVPLIIRPLDVRKLTERRLGNPLLRWGINLGWDVAGRTLWRERHAPNGRGHPSLSIVEDKALDESYDRLWDQVKTKYDVFLVRDRAFLQWRFVDIPTREYEILSARHDSQILGYVVLRQADIRGTMTGLIADFLVVPGEQGDRAGSQLLSEAMRRFRHAELALTGGLMLPHTQEYAIMRRAGYLRAPDRFAPQPFHLFVRPYTDEPPLDVLTRPESWYVSIADHDAV